MLRTIGISKSKLTMQFVAELLMARCVALLIGAGVDAVMSKSVSNSLLASEISSSKESQEKVGRNFGGPGGSGGPGGASNAGSASGDKGEFNPMEMGGSKSFGAKGKPQVEAYESIDAVVNMTVLVELLVIGLTLILISSLAAMISIQRFSPLTILKERS